MFRDARWISAPEATWRIYEYDLSEIHLIVLSLQLYLPGMQSVPYKEGENLNNVIDRKSRSKTMLTKYFKMNNMDADARNYL